MKEMDDAIHSEITRLCAEGDALAEAGKYEEAITQCYDKAWDLLPDPKEQWNAATWILAAIGDAGFLGRMFNAAWAALEHAVLQCPGGMGNEFIHLRLGQIAYENGNLDRAANELLRAYMGKGTDIFEGQDPKYLKFLRTRAKNIA